MSLNKPVGPLHSPFCHLRVDLLLLPEEPLALLVALQHRLQRQGVVARHLLLAQMKCPQS